MSKLACPALRPRDQRHELLDQIKAKRGQAVALVRIEVDQRNLTKLLNTVVQHRRADLVAGGLERPKRQLRITQLPQHAHRPAPAEQIDQRHDRSSGARPANTSTRSWT